MTIEKTNLEGVLLVKPDVHEDFRGEYVETYNEKFYSENGIPVHFVQDDISLSSKGVLRGIHGDGETYKLISCMKGRFYFVVVNCDEKSKDFGKWESFVLSEKNRWQVLVPPKYGNGHLALSKEIIFHYKQSAYYNPKGQFSYCHDDPKFKIWWPIKNLLSPSGTSSENMLKGKKILLTGAAGFLGANVMEELLKTGAVLRGTIHKKPIVITDPRIEYVTADLTKKEDCERAVAGMDYVIMCAASTAGAPFVAKNPLAIVTPSVVMNAFMLEAAYEAGVQKFVFISSNAVYPPYEHPVKEEEMMSGPPFIKYYPISWMKRFGEILCETYSTWIKKPMKTVVIRPANMYGPLDNFDIETSHVVPALIRKVVEHRDPVEVWGDGKEIKDLIYVKDFVEGLLLALEKIETYDPINLGTRRAGDGHGCRHGCDRGGRLQGCEDKVRHLGARHAPEADAGRFEGRAPARLARKDPAQGRHRKDRRVVQKGLPGRICGGLRRSVQRSDGYRGEHERLFQEISKEVIPASGLAVREPALYAAAGPF